MLVVELRAAAVRMGLERSGAVTRVLRPLINIATEEAEGLTAALGGPDRVTPQQRILIEDLCSTGIALRAVQALFLQSPDPDLASKIGTLAGARRASLLAIGLERLEKEVPDLADYLAAKAASSEESTQSASETHEKAVSGTNGSTPDFQDSLPADASACASDGNGGGAPGLDSSSGPAAAATSTNDQED